MYHTTLSKNKQTNKPLMLHYNSLLVTNPSAPQYFINYISCKYTILSLAHKTDLILKNAVKEGKNRNREPHPNACHDNCRSLERGINQVSRFFKKSHKNTNEMKNFVIKSRGGESNFLLQHEKYRKQHFVWSVVMSPSRTGLSHSSS